MAETSIEWTDKTWNPTRGCSRVSQGCVNCYAEKQALRFSAPPVAGVGQDDSDASAGGPFHGFVTKVNGHAAWTGKVELVQSMLTLPLSWRKPCRIFVNSMSDLFHEALPDEAIDRVFAVMALCPQHTFQILTKRPERMLKYLSSRARSIEFWEQEARSIGYTFKFFDLDGAERSTCPFPLPNVWLGVSVEDQATADERIPLLLQTPAAIRFVSYEPALGPVDFFTTPWTITQGNIHWIICGGESGPGARPFSLEWMRTTVEQCAMAGVAVFCKQIGANPRWAGYKLGRARPNDRKGGSMEEWPEDLRIRQFPFVQSADKVHNDSGRAIKP